MLSSRLGENRLIQIDFRALFIKVKSIIFRPPFSRSPIIVFFLILAILLSQIKLSKLQMFTLFFSRHVCAP